MTSRSCWAFVRRQAASIWGFDPTILISLQWSRGKMLLGEGSESPAATDNRPTKVFDYRFLLR